MNRAVALLLKAGLSVVLFGWIFRSVDVGQLRSTLAGLSGATLLIAAALMASQGVVLGWRWHRIVQRLGGRLPAGQAIRWVYIGLFFNQALPTSVGGDVVRVHYLSRAGSAPGLAFASVAIERGTGVALMAVMATLCLPAVWGVMGPHSARLALALTGPGIVAALVLLAFGSGLLPGWLPSAVAMPLAAFAKGLRQFIACPLALAEISVLGLASTLAALWAAYLLGHELGIELPFAAYVTLATGAVLMSVLPISLGGWGVRESVMVALFGSVGVAPERALALSLVWGVLPLLVSLPGGVLWWAQSNRVGVGQQEYRE